MSKNMGETLMSFFILKILWFRLLVFRRKTSARFFYLCLCLGETFNFIFHREVFCGFAFQFSTGKLVSDFFICVQACGETFNFIFHPEDFCGFAFQFSIEKLVSDFSICVYVWGETLMSFFILQSCIVSPLLFLQSLTKNADTLVKKATS